MFFRVQKSDPLFGLVVFRRDFGLLGSGLWEGEVEFAPAGKRVKIYVPGRSGGIAEQQREFYRELEARYFSLIKDISGVLAEMPVDYDAGPDFPAGRDEVPDWRGFEPVSINLPKISDLRQEWWLEYRYLPSEFDSNWLVNFEGWKLTYGEYSD